MQLNEVRAALKRHIDGGVTQSSVARALGMSAATVSQFLKGSYRGDNEKMGEQVTRYLDLEAMRTAQARKKAFVPTAAANTVLTCAEFAHVNRDIALVYGEPGTGKTAALKHYAASHTGVTYVLLDPSAAKERPVVAGLLRKLLRAKLGQNDPLYLAVADLVEALEGTGHCIILDEAQHLGFKAAEILRRIHDEAEVGLVLCGHTMLYDRMFGAGQSVYAQMYSRIGIQRYIDAGPSIDDVRAFVESMGGDPDARTLAWLTETMGTMPGAYRLIEKCWRLAESTTAHDGKVGLGQAKAAAKHIIGAAL